MTLTRRVLPWLTLPYPMDVIKRAEALRQEATFVRATGIIAVCAVILSVHATVLLVTLMAGRIAGMAAQAGVVGWMPPRVGLPGVATVFVSTLSTRAPYTAVAVVLWMEPELELRCVAVFAICTAMVDSVSGRRADPLLFLCDNLLILGGLMMFCVMSAVLGRELLEIWLIGGVSFCSYAFYLYVAREVFETRGALNAAQARQIDQAKTEALGRLTGGVAHDFNNLLTVIGGNLDLIEQIHDPGEHKVLLDEARMATARATQVTGQLLAYSRRASMHPERFDVADSLAELDMLMRRLLPRNVGFDCVCARPGPTVRLDKGQFDTVLLNLCINARDATSAGGTIAVRAVAVEMQEPTVQTAAGPLPPGTYVRITVEDDGTGMPPEVLRRVFEPYFTTKAKGQGAGMGMSMARGFAEQSGGWLGIQSQLGVGSVATLLLPALHAPSAVAVELV